MLFESEDASDQAHKLGLTSAGWGYWKDKSGKTVAQTIQGKLVKLESHPDAFEEYLNAFTDDLRERLNLKSLEMFPNPNSDDIRLDTIIVSKENQGKGVGTEALEAITRFADKHGKRVTLTPALKDTHHGTTSQSRLIKFYKQFGFVLNKGRNKDFTVSDLMIREPRK
ncbi:MAG: GNAT family N-acetyltransferase [Bacteroidetes bacterium]|nr:GNAT family N-acetyltransferase [Bacteroidota bacterium]